MTSIQLFTTLVSGGITVGRSTTSGPLTLFPLRHCLAPGDHLLYQDAHTRGLVTIEETSLAGTVGELTVTNAGPQTVLLLEGEVLLGMKQTRVLNVSVLVPGRTVLTVPVSCVEAGRWRHTSRAALGRDVLNLSPRVRCTTAASVLRSVRATGRYASNQMDVWRGVGALLADHGVDTPTGSFADMTRARGEEILDRIRGLRPEPDQSGVLACIGSEPICLDLFDGPATLSAVWKALVGSYVGDAEVEARRPASRGAKPPTRSRVIRWVASLAAGQAIIGPPLGLGERLTSIGPRFEASVLLHDHALIHLAAFPARG